MIDPIYLILLNSAILIYLIVRKPRTQIMRIQGKKHQQIQAYKIKTRKSLTK